MGFLISRGKLRRCSELAELAQLIEQRKLEPIIDRVFPFSEIGEAIAYLEAGQAKGKMVVRMGEE